MKFCFVDRVSGPAIWRVIEPVATALVAKGNDVDYVLFDDGNELSGLVIPDKVNVIKIPVPPKRSFFGAIKQQAIFARSFRRYLAEKKPDVVHTNFAVPSIVARWMAARGSVPYVVSTQHELYGSMSIHYRWGLRLTERYCSAVVYVSETAARSFGRKAEKVEKAHFGRKTTHVVIPNGVDVDEIHAAIATHIPKIRGKLVCAGRMVPVKGQALLLQALSKTLEHHPQIKLSLIGSGPMEAELRGMVERMNLKDNVEFRGWLSHQEVLRELASADLVVVPSSSVQEGFCLVLAETLLCGTALLVSDTPLFHEVLDGFPGRSLFFAEGNLSALAEGLKDYFFNASSIIQPLAPLTGIEEARLSADTMAEAYLTLYRRLSLKI